MGAETPIRHFLTVDDLQPDELTAVLDLADDLKAERPSPASGSAVSWDGPLTGKSVALIFEKPSTRTRVSFEVGVRELGGHPVVLTGQQLQLGRGETISDTARVLSEYVHAIVLRTFGQDRLEGLAEAGQVPIVNALSDIAHPCQALADLQTIREYKGALHGVRLTYLGDGNNMAHSLLKAGAMAGMHVTVGHPDGYAPMAQIVDEARTLAEFNDGSITITTDPAAACEDADVLYTDVWASMGQESESEERSLLFKPYQLNAGAVDMARPDAIVMHCLPAHRGEEISADVIDGDASVVFSQAANRLHAQKALLMTLLG